MLCMPMSTYTKWASACPLREMCSGHVSSSNRGPMYIPEKTFLNLHEVGAAIDRSSRIVLRLIHDHQLKAH